MGNSDVQYDETLYLNPRSVMTVTHEIDEAGAFRFHGLAFRQSVKPGCETAFRESARNMMHEASTFPGYGSSAVIRLSETGREWLLIVHFNNMHALHRWESSQEYQRWWCISKKLNNQIEVVQAGEPEGWFVIPEQSKGLPNVLPKWKMALLTIMGLYPLVLLVFPRLASLAAQWGMPEWLGKLLTVMLAVPAMTWCIVPLLTHLLGRWLYPAKKHNY